MSTNFDSVIAQQRLAINSLITQRNATSGELDELRAQGSTDAARIGQLRAQVLGFDPQIQLAQQQLTEILREQADDDIATRAAIERHAGASLPTNGTLPATTTERSSVYSPGDDGMFLRDLFAFSTGQARRDTQERLERHEQAARSTGLLTERALSTPGMGGIVPPQYLVDQYAAVVRAGRPTANIVTHAPLPESGMSLVIPRGTTGVTTGVQAAQNAAVSNTDAAFVDLTIPIVTIAGRQDVSRQAVERGIGVDQIVFGDLAAAYAVSLNQEVLSGTGTGGRALGILNTAGIAQASAFTAAATVATFMQKLSGALNAVQNGRYLAADAIVMHPRRWSWLTMQTDSTGRPLIVPTGSGPGNALGTVGTPIVDASASLPVGQLLGIPVYTDPAIPTAVGTGPEDQVIVMRGADHILWEDGGAPFQLAFEQVAPGNLTVTLVAYGYIGFTAARFPGSTAVIGGNAGTAGFGLVAPTW